MEKILINYKKKFIVIKYYIFIMSIYYKNIMRLNKNKNTYNYKDFVIISI